MAIELQRLATSGETGYIAKHNENYGAIETAVNALEAQKLAASARGAADGVASLGPDGKVLTSQLPALSGYEEKIRRGVADGYAALGADGKVPLSQLPTSLPADPALIDFSPYQARDEKGEPDGYAGLGPDGKVPAAQLPAAALALFLAQAFVPGRPAAGAVLLAILPSVTVTFAAAFASSRAKAGVAATAETVLTVKKNGAAVGTVTFAAGSAAGVFAAAAETVVTNADELTVDAPAIQDATLADVRFTLHGTR